MKTKTYMSQYDDEIIVEELTRKEFIEWAISTIEAVNEYNSDDDTLWVEYKDGTHYSCGYEPNGKFRKTNIVFGLISNGNTWQVFGEYELDENMIPQRSEL